MTHELKIHPTHYWRAKEGIKTFEIRENDRVFQMGDEVVLKEWDPTPVEEVKSEYAYPGSLLPAFRIKEKGYTGSEDLRFKIGCVYPIDEKRVVFSLLKRDWNE